MDEKQVRDMLHRLCAEAGGQKSWADANGVSQQYVSDVLRGKTVPAGKILAAMGLKRKDATYEPA